MSSKLKYEAISENSLQYLQKLNTHIFKDHQFHALYIPEPNSSTSISSLKSMR